MTRRARLFALASAMGLVAGLVREQYLLSLLSLASLAWFIVEWIRFYLYSQFVLPQLVFMRTVNGNSETKRSLWAGRNLDVEVSIVKKIRLSGMSLTLVDVAPENLAIHPRSTAMPSIFSDEISDEISNQKALRRLPPALLRFSNSWLCRRFIHWEDPDAGGMPNQQTLDPNKELSSWRYSARVRGAGNLIFPGIRMTLQSAHGLFRMDMFTNLPGVFRVLPSFANAGEYRSLTKTSNLLQHHGVHRLKQSGMGTELLELREYLPGDPPKSIAWKASAKREHWLTRQYEAEVPVRVQFFLDGSQSSRMGGFGKRLLDQMTFVAASVARAAANLGDPVGGVLFDERGMRRFPPVAGEKGFQIWLRALSDFSVNPAPMPQPLSLAMMNAVLRVMQDRYPELLDPRVHSVPFAILPVLPSRRSIRRRRFLVAGAMAEIYDLQSREHVQLIEDDRAMAARAQSLLNDCGVPWVTPVIARAAKRDPDPAHRMAWLSDSLTQAVTLARDNEVFVILSDMLDCPHAVKQLFPVVKLATAKHHRVSIISPTSTFRRPDRGSVDKSTEHAGIALDESREALLWRAEQARIRIVAKAMTRDWKRCGASFSLSGEERAIRLIMNELDSARTGRRVN